MTQWIVSQQSNVYHQKDAYTLHQALLQVILTVKDSNSLPWMVVHNTRATCRHRVGEGQLTWDNNAISACHIFVMNHLVTSSQGAPIPCQACSPSRLAYVGLEFNSRKLRLAWLCTKPAAAVSYHLKSSAFHLFYIMKCPT